MNHTIYTDTEKNAIRFSNFKKLESECSFSGLGIKYVASGEEIYYANDKKYKVNAGEYIIWNESTKSIVRIDHAEMVQGLCIDISSEIISEVAEFHDVNGSELKEFLLSDQFFVNRYNVKNTSLGYSLNEINQKIKTGTFTNDLQKNELFYSLELAKLDLLSGEEILYTALRYGFADTPTFSMAFKMQFGVTPGLVKKSNF
jgi:hypothetical protein